MSTMKVARKEAVELFQKLGRKAANDWDNDKINKKIRKIKEDTEDVEIPKDLSTKDSLLTRILDALDKGSKVKVISDEDAKQEAADAKEKGKEKGKDGKKKEHKMNRLEASVRAIQALKSKGMTKAELADAGDAIYAKNGGTANQKEANWAMRLAIEVCETLGIISVDGQDVKPAKKAEEKAEAKS